MAGRRGGEVLMSTFDVLQRYGTAALVRFAGTVALFLVLHLVRIPFVLAERVLAGVMVRLNTYATAQATRAPARPVNQFFPHDFASTKEAAHV